MQELFRLEAEGQGQLLTAGLLALERDPTAPDQLEACMRAAHSLKGAARLVGLSAGVGVAHAMEDCFVAAQHGDTVLGPRQIDLLLAGVDLLMRIGATPAAEVDRWTGENRAQVDAFTTALAAMAHGAMADAAPPLAEAPPPGPASEALADADPSPAANAAPSQTPDANPSPATDAAPSQTPDADPSPAANAAPSPAPEQAAPGDRVLRVAAQDLNRLLGLASESLVESRWLKPFSDSLLRLHRLHQNAGKALDELRGGLASQAADERVQALFAAVQSQLAESRHALAERLAELDVFDSRSTDLARRLYDEVLACRMQPFADGVRGFPKLLRNLARALGKQVRLEIVGETTQVDRDILEKLDTALAHLLHNAIDHGIEPPAARLAAGKPAEGVIRMEARHGAGMLHIVVSDDGGGIDPHELRRAVVARRLTNAETAARLTEAELLEFLFLPSFTMKPTVTEISGRGVGLDAVQTMVKQVRGSVRVTSRRGAGTQFQLQLPLTLSVVRALLVDIGGDAYAFPLAQIRRSVRLRRSAIELIEGRQHFRFDGRPAGLVGAWQLLGGRPSTLDQDEISIVVLGDGASIYGLVVDRFLDERELVVQPLDARLGKVQDIAAGALMKDGAPALIVDVADLLRSVDKLAAGGGLDRLQRASAVVARPRKRVLVVDDSLTVRELERKLLDQHGYEVEAAVDGMDGWNAVRTGHFNLVVTDVDMPRMDGIELVKLIRKDPQLMSLPVMIVSYKDREDDHRRGLEAGADYYLTKGSFHDETLVQAVIDLIGRADS